jgi:hypothetical protein
MCRASIPVSSQNPNLKRKKNNDQTEETVNIKDWGNVEKSRI